MGLIVVFWDSILLHFSSQPARLKAISQKRFWWCHDGEDDSKQIHQDSNQVHSLEE
jgi:hypothetical protein